MVKERNDTYLDDASASLVEVEAKETKVRFDYDLALAGADIGLFDWDIRGGTVFFSKRWKSMLGYEADALEGTLEEWKNLLHPDDKEAVLEALEGYLRGDIGRYEVEFRARCKDGQYRWILARGKAQWDANGEALRMAGSHTDITQRKNDDERVVSYARELKALHEIAKSFILEHDLQMYPRVLEIVLDAIESPRGMFGYVEPSSGNLVVPTGDQMLLAYKEDGLRKFARDEWAEFVWHRALSEGKGLYSNEPTRLGTSHDVMLSRYLAFPILYQDNVIGLILGADKARDYRADDLEILEKLAIGISPILKARLDSDVHEARLNTAMDALSRSNSELEQFAYVASHDLQEPLRMVASYTQLLANRYGDLLDEKGLKYVGYAVDGAHRMQKLINDLLALSRVRTRGGDFKKVDIHGVVGEVQAIFQDKMVDANAVMLCEELPTIVADGSQMKQLFQNLIGNAFKYRSDTPLLIHISVSEEKDSWRFTVRDNGIGIDMKFADRIFQLFERLHSHSEYSGTGIGLAICKLIVERHGGRIWLDASEGEGTRFCFTILKGLEEESHE